MPETHECPAPGCEEQLPYAVFEQATAKFAHLGRTMNAEQLDALKRDLASGECDLCSFPVAYQLIGLIDELRYIIRSGCDKTENRELEEVLNAK